MSDLEAYEHSAEEDGELSEDGSSPVRGIHLRSSDSDDDDDYSQRSSAAGSERGGLSLASGDELSDDDSQIVLNDQTLRTPAKASSPSEPPSSAKSTKTPRGLGRRYFDPKDISTKCFRCREVGHIAAHCVNESVEICSLCGQRDHLIHRCPYEQCWACLQPGHQQRDCQNRRASAPSAFCCLCGSSAHETARCHWTASAEDLRSVHCYTCGEAGHIKCEVSRSLFAAPEPEELPNNEDSAAEEDSDEAPARKLTRKERKLLKIEQSKERKLAKKNKQQKKSKKGKGSASNGGDSEGAELSALPPMSRVYLQEHDDCPPNPDADPSERASQGAGLDASRTVGQCSNCGSRDHGISRCPAELMRPVMLTAMVNRRPGSANSNSASSRRCFHCNQAGHLSRSCPERSNQLPQCHRCHQYGHIAVDCPQRSVYQNFQRFRSGADHSNPQTPASDRGGNGFRRPPHSGGFGPPSHSPPPSFPLMALQQGYTPEPSRQGGGRYHTPQHTVHHNYQPHSSHGHRQHHSHHQPHFSNHQQQQHHGRGSPYEGGRKRSYSSGPGDDSYRKRPRHYQ